MLITFVILTITTGILISVMLMLDRGTRYSMNKAEIINSARGSVELVAMRLRNEFVQFNTVGANLGVNFDLDDSGSPVVRDGMLFYVDANHKALMYSDDASGAPAFASLDDRDLDGNADLVGIGLIPQDDNEDGVQDFIDTNVDGTADDVDGDTVNDPLWKLVLVHFEKLADVTTVSDWQNGQVMARHIYIKRIAPGGALSGPNIDTFRYLAKSAVALLSDINSDGVVDEVELGDLSSADDIINHVDEIAMIDSVSINLHMVTTGTQGMIMKQDIKTQITPRSMQLFRINGVVGLADATDSTQLDQDAF